MDGKVRDSFTRAFIERKVTLVGAVDRLELWNRAEYAFHMRELEADRISLQPTIDNFSLHMRRYMIMIGLFCIFLSGTFDIV